MSATLLGVADDTAADPWAALGERFVGGQLDMRGRVRTHVIHEHLRAHLPPPPAAIVDVGGGAGHQSVPLAVEATRRDPYCRLSRLFHLVGRRTRA